MRLPRVRFKVRRMMIAVAVVAMVTGMYGLARRSTIYESKARLNADREVLSRDLMASFANPDRPEVVEICRQEYAVNLARAEHEGRLKLKYLHAARYPWHPVEPDPPEPE
jgi:hypothetical protein